MPPTAADPFARDSMRTYVFGRLWREGRLAQLLQLPASFNDDLYAWMKDQVQPLLPCTVHVLNCAATLQAEVWCARIVGLQSAWFRYYSLDGQGNEEAVWRVRWLHEVRMGLPEAAATTLSWLANYSSAHAQATRLVAPSKIEAGNYFRSRLSVVCQIRPFACLQPFLSDSGAEPSTMPLFTWRIDLINSG